MMVKILLLDTPFITRSSKKFRIKDNKLQAIKTVLENYLPGIIINRDYHPEEKRYGGKQNLNIIEEVFCMSSYITSYYLGSKTVEERILLAIELNDILFQQLQIQKTDLKKIYLYLNETWLNYSTEVLNIKVKNIEYISNSLMQKLSRHTLTNIPYINEYYSLIFKLNNLNYKNFEQENPEYSVNLAKLTTELELNKPFFNTIISLAHMNFNRLGLFPHIESIIYKILSNASHIMIGD